MTTKQKNQVLGTLAELIEKHQQDILARNKTDLDLYTGKDAAMLDRLKMNDSKIAGMIAAIHHVRLLEDPIGKILYTHTREDGLTIENQIVPFGKILIIYESRPDVTIEAAITAFKAGNTILLKGGKEARHTNLYLVELWHKALAQHGLSDDKVQYLDMNRIATQQLIQNNTKKVDLIIPRGGDGLINFVLEHADVPVVVSGRGNNFLFADKGCNFDMAISLILNGKQRLSVCNALDKVLLHKDIPQLEEKLGKLVHKLLSMELEVYGDAKLCALNDQLLKMPDPAMMSEEFLSAKILLRQTDGIDAAIETINTYSGGHTAVIVSNSTADARRFMHDVDCAAVYHNASTRFTDGGQFGLGAEIAISTQKLHFRGPIGMEQLVTNKWFGYGNGQIRK
jgi:glutamate-5-semialdehyde dehydrogenase